MSSSTASSGSVDDDGDSWTDKVSDDASVEDKVFLVMIAVGVLVLSSFLLYLICRICCYDFWARCCKGVKRKLSPGSEDVRRPSRWSAMDKKDMVRRIILAQSTPSAKERWAEDRRVSDVSFATGPGDEDDQIIYHVDRDDVTMEDTFRRKSFGSFGNSLNVPSLHGGKGGGGHHHGGGSKASHPRSPERGRRHDDRSHQHQSQQSKRNIGTTGTRNHHDYY